MARREEVRGIIAVLRRFARRFSSELRNQRLLLTGSFGAMSAEVLLRLLEPWPFAIVIDHVLGFGREGDRASFGALGNLDPTTLLGVAAVLLVCVVALRALAASVSAAGFALAGNRLLTHARSALFRRLQERSLAVHKRTRSGDLALRVIGDAATVKEVVVTTTLPLLANLLILLGMLSVMLWMQWQLTLVALLAVPLCWWFTVRLGEEKLRDGAQAARVSARLERTIDVLGALATALVLFLGTRVILRGGMSPGELVVFLIYLKGGFRPARNLAKYTARLAKAGAAAKRVLEVLEPASDVRDLPGSREAAAIRGAVRFEHASFGYGSSDAVLRDVDFSIEPGERIAIVGASGSGKSTLLGAILRLHDAREGRVLIDGQDIRSFTLESLRRQVCIVLQDTMVFSASIKDNIACGAPEATIGDIEAASHLANAHEFISSLPGAYDAMIGERGLDLSAEQRQRLAIARAAISRAPIVVFDEPLVGLDDANARAVSEALDRLAEGRTSFLITHDVLEAERCDRTIVLEGGRIAEIGSHHELLKLGDLYAAMFAVARARVEARVVRRLHAVGS